MRDEKKKSSLLVDGIVLIVFLSIVGCCSAGYAHFVYGDWKCAISKCVRVK